MADPPHITETVPVDPVGLTWIRCSDESTAEIATGPIATVGELMERLQHVPPDTPLLVSGYESGYTTAHLAIAEVQRLDRHGEQDYRGDFEAVAEAQRQVAQSADECELAVGRITPPALVGEPIVAAVLSR